MAENLTLPHVALVGNPNAGKTALFNALTGARQKVANYPGVTVERKAARLMLPDGFEVELIDLPGTYSLNPKSPDEAVTANVLSGAQAGEKRPDAIICVLDASNLRNHLKFALELKAQGLPMIIALNMTDLAKRDGIEIDVKKLQALLAIPVISTVAVRKAGLADLLAKIAPLLKHTSAAPQPTNVRDLHARANDVLAQVMINEGAGRATTRRIDDVVLHPVFGLMLLALILFVMFQAVFAWAEAPMQLIEAAIATFSQKLSALLPEGWIKSLLIDGIIAGVGAVVVFLPQIIILFAFILALEQSGYMTRAAFLMDQLMAKVGLNGRAFIPLLSSFACAIPGIMATRSIDNPRDRLTTIMIAPLMTCSARLPVYAVIIAAFIPASKVGGIFGLQGLVLFGLYLAGIIGAFVVAFVLRRTLTKGQAQPFIMEMPQYQLPILRDLLIGLYQRAKIFLKRAGTIILASMIILWLFSSFPLDSNGARPTLDQSLTGKIGAVLEVVFAPIGFNREIAIALVPGMAAREVAVGALGQVYALSGSEEAVAGGLVNILRSAWSLPTALAFLAWFVFAPQCISTIAVTRRETNGWRWPLFMLGYLFALAYGAAGATYWIATALLT
jgi:ferrous iron transport protein B